MKMMKKIITLFLLTSFLAVAFFSFALMTYTPDGQMAGDCPLSAAGLALCPQGILNVAVHHISTYHSFFNLPLIFGLIIALIIFGGRFLFRPPIFSIRFGNAPPVYFSQQKRIQWLARLENSPS